MNLSLLGGEKNRICIRLVPQCNADLTIIVVWPAYDPKNETSKPSFQVLYTRQIALSDKPLEIWIDMLHDLLRKAVAAPTDFTKKVTNAKSEEKFVNVYHYTHIADLRNLYLAAGNPLLKATLTDGRAMQKDGPSMSIYDGRDLWLGTSYAFQGIPEPDVLKEIQGKK